MLVLALDGRPDYSAIPTEARIHVHDLLDPGIYRDDEYG